MISAWTKHLKDPEEKNRFALSVQGSKVVLDRLKELLKEEETNLERDELGIKTFETPGWAFKQAYQNGYRKGIRYVTELIDLDQKENSK